MENSLKPVRIGFIGFGKMAQAIVQGWRKQKREDLQIFAYAPNQKKLEHNCQELDCIPCSSAEQCADQCKVLILACKPVQVPGVLEELKGHLENKLVVCVAAGMSFDVIDEALGSVHHVSIMPNTAMAQQAGIVIVEEKNTMDTDDLALFEDLFAPLAMIETVGAKQFGIAGTISGCSGAFLGLYAEALADAGVKYGLTRDAAARLSAQAILGAGAMLAGSGLEPSVFKNNVCSPGGTTIKGIVTLEKDGFRKAVIEAIEAIMEPERY